MTSILKVDTIQDQAGNNIINESSDTITIGASGDTITIPSGATLSSTDPLVFPAGTVSLPAITTTGDTNTGIFFPAADTIGFAEGGAEAMRIDLNGNVLVGTTTASGKLFSSTSSTSQPALRGASTSASYSDNIIAIDANRNTTNNTFYAISYYNDAATAHKFRVADSGNVTNTNNSYGSISDIKLKENIVDATLKLEKLNQVRIVNFNFINDNQKQIGVIAQELENIFPSMVEESPDKDLEGNDLGTTTKQVKYSVFVPILIKAIQELSAKVDIQQTKIDALEARITTLENN